MKILLSKKFQEIGRLCFKVQEQSLLNSTQINVSQVSCALHQAAFVFTDHDGVPPEVIRELQEDLSEVFPFCIRQMESPQSPIFLPAVYGIARSAFTDLMKELVWRSHGLSGYFRVAPLLKEAKPPEEPFEPLWLYEPTPILRAVAVSEIYGPRNGSKYLADVLAEHYGIDHAAETLAQQGTDSNRRLLAAWGVI